MLKEHMLRGHIMRADMLREQTKVETLISFFLSTRFEAQGRFSKRAIQLFDFLNIYYDK